MPSKVFVSYVGYVYLWFVKSKFSGYRMNKRLVILTILALLFSCAPDPQHKGYLFIMNKTGQTLYVETNILSATEPGDYCQNYEIIPGGLAGIANTETKQEEDRIVIESFLTNPEDSKVDIFVKEGEELVLVKTYNYADKDKSPKELFNLNHCTLNDQEDPRKRFHVVQFFFEITTADLPSN